VPEFAVKFMFGEMGEETLLASQRLAPTLLEESGFAFEYPTLAAALAHELNSA
jgi:NAD dependent epimerase/dehydratase family enzyme